VPVAGTCKASLTSLRKIMIDVVVVVENSYTDKNFDDNKKKLCFFQEKVKQNTQRSKSNYQYYIYTTKDHGD
jgi:hypothetical protein